MKLQEQTLKKIRSVRVKTVEMHPTRSLCIIGLYNGYLQTWNTTNATLINEVQVSDFPIRTLAYVSKNNYILVGADDGRIYIYELNNLQRLDVLDAHDDFIRRIVIHHKEEEFLTCSDDGTIKLWEIGTELKCINIYKGHNHFVMDIAYNPKNTQEFVSCSLDATIKIWDKYQQTCIKTLKGHTTGINSICFNKEGNYLISGSDDLLIKIWDIVSGRCISSLPGHTNNVINVYYLEKMPYFVSCSEDGTYRIWDTETYDCIDIINLDSGRVWQFKEKDNAIVIGTDDEIIFKKIKTGTNHAIMKNKKICFTYQNTIYSCKTDDIHNIKNLIELDYFPEEINMSENGKFISLSDERNFYIFLSLGFRKKFKGNGKNLHFLNNENFLVLNGNKIDFYNKSEIIKSLKIDGIKEIKCIDNYIIGVFSNSSSLYSMEGKRIFSWNYKIKNSALIEKFLIVELNNLIMCYEINTDLIEAYLEQDLEIPEKGIPDSLNLLEEFNIGIGTSCNTENMFVFEYNQKGYYILLGDRPFLYNFGVVNGQICGIEGDNIYCHVNKQIEIIKLDMEFINFQRRILNGEKCEVDEKYRLSAISFYESLNMHDEALRICKNDIQKFEILLKLNKLDEASKMSNSKVMYEKIAREYLKRSNFSKASENFYKAQKWKSLLFTDLLSDKKYLKEVGDKCVETGDNNYALIAYMKCKDYEKCGELLKNTKFCNIFQKTFLK